jgi:aryl-alcohol dehydrogenase-like predicted oxidoreductase
MAMTRTLGRSGRTVSALGFGCWAIGGPWQSDGQPAGWGQVDDQESVAAIRRAVDLGVSLFDTADVYGCGHSERVLGQALAGVRDQVVVATKFGLVFDEQRRTSAGVDVSRGYIRRAGAVPAARAGQPVPLAAGDGSADREIPARAAAGRRRPARGDPYWDYFKPGRMEAWLQQVAAIREVLTAGGRTLAQGALAWLWARSAITIPIPGFKTVAQAEENAGAMAFGPLSDQQVREVDTLLHGQART